MRPVAEHDRVDAVLRVLGVVVAAVLLLTSGHIHADQLHDTGEIEVGALGWTVDADHHVHVGGAGAGDHGHESGTDHGEDGNRPTGLMLVAPSCTAACRVIGGSTTADVGLLLPAPRQVTSPVTEGTVLRT